MTNALAGHRRVLVFGGSFDPPHKAHVELPRQAARAIDADLIAYVPAGRAPHKLGQEQTRAEHRLAMLQLALQDQPGTTIITDEIDRGTDRPSYTVDTLEVLHRKLDPGAELRLLIGADQLRIFDSWREPERIIGLAQPVVMVRPPDTRASLLGSLPADQRSTWSARLVDVDAMDVSSTEVRDRLARGESVTEWVDAEVLRYIGEHQLYCTR